MADVWENAVEDVKKGRAIVMPVRVARSVRGLRINPVGVVEEKGKKRIVHDSTFSSEPEQPGGRGRPVNETTDWDQIPECHLAGVMGQIIKRVLGLRNKFGTGKRILIQKMDVKSAFRQVGVDPAGAANFGYVLGGYLFIDLRLQFGWRGSPGWWGVIASAIQQAQRQTTRASATILAAGKEATAHVQVAGHTGVAVEPLPRGCIVAEAEGGGEEDPAWVVFFMDDAVSVEVQWEAGGGRCLVLSQALASNHHQAMGERAVGEEPLLSHKKVTDWAPRQEVLGFDLDTERMTISLPGRKITELREMLQEWPEERSKATVREVLVLAGKLHHVAYVIRPGRYFVRRLLQLSKLHLNGQEKRGGGGAWGKDRKKAEARRVVYLTEEFMADVEWWRWCLTEGLAGRGEELAAPFFRFVKQPHKRTWFSDASFEAVGGLCLETGVYWRYNLTGEERARTVRSRRREHVNRLSINVLELLGMVMTAFVMIVIRKDRPGRVGEPVLMRGDSSSAVQWVKNCKGGKGEVRSGGMMRILGVLEQIGGWCFQAKHVRGVENGLADGITRWKEDEIQSRLTKECPAVPWQVQELGPEGEGMCSEILHAATDLGGLRSRLERLMRKVGECG